VSGDEYRNRLVYYDLDDDYDETVLIDGFRATGSSTTVPAWRSGRETTSG